MRPVARDRGVLLTHSWRMHPDVCEFISDLMYEGRLQSAERCQNQQLLVEGLPSSGIIFVPVEHSDGKSRSRTEAANVVGLVERLLAGHVVKHDGAQHRLQPGDIIIVTPYNAQRRCIEQLLRQRGPRSSNVRVGTVDKFQGQEADVVIFSSATANPDDAPRGIEFIFDRNRINVAISRAHALAIYLGSPRLAESRPTSVKRLLSLNVLCSLVGCG